MVGQNVEDVALSDSCVPHVGSARKSVASVWRKHLHKSPTENESLVHWSGFSFDIKRTAQKPGAVPGHITEKLFLWRPSSGSSDVALASTLPTGGL